MMYYYWKEKGIRPSVFYSMPIGERLIVQAFYENEIEEKNKSRQEMKNSETPIFPVIVL
ncbi:hypothetical protein [Clostridium aciditolerans]|uniref:Uncharacterized protein n=1 Tax=Clostridium aciditolerans TaxID=339861 RepID=A0A934HYU6_9CLOT|nr:hypothetical protein [Clostridium aciditolerans]MBI6873744.1 hypothetical protein [Clostridium aciditolerans]